MRIMRFFMNLNWLLNWNFKSRQSFLLAHKLHRYPATFLPELAEKVISTYSKEGDVVLDIFSGSGTTILEARRLQRQAIGIELNPLAILITQVKNTYIKSAILLNEVEKWRQAFLTTECQDKLNINNIDYWFHATTIKSLSSALSALAVVSDNRVQDFLKVCLSEILREVSWCVHSGFKIHRDKSKFEKSLAFDKLDLLKKLEPVLSRNIQAIEQLKDIQTDFSLHFQDSRLYCEKILPQSVDLILTSPPYGDSKTTVAYGQFSAFSSELFNLNSLSNNAVRHLDNDLLGGQTKNVDVNELVQHSLTLQNIQELFLAREKLAVDEKESKRTLERLKDILTFYADLELCIKNGSEYLKQEGFFVLVTASRIVHNTKLHTDIIISELAQHYGLTLKNIYYRDILNKRMPSKVSAINVKGVVADTMTKESIIVLQKN